MTAVAPTQDSEAQDALASVEARWNRGAQPWSADGLTAVYTADALFFGGRPGQFVGHDEIHAYFRSYEGVILSGRMTLVDQQVRLLAPHRLLAQGFVDFAFELAGGQSTRSRLRTTLVLAREPGANWHICQHHFSPTPEAPPLGQS